MKTAAALNLFPSVLLVGLCFAFTRPSVNAAPGWGRLANPEFDGERIKTTLFFAGQASDGSTPYGCTQFVNTHTYTLNPVPRDNHLNWTNSINRDFVLNLMISAGINVVTMSSWGEDFHECSNNWVTGAAPMQTSPEAHNDGDHIQLLTGTYQETLTFSKRLTVKAAGGPVTIGP